MPVRVKQLATGKVAEVPSAVAVRGLGSEYELVDGRVRVIAPDGSTGTVSRDKIQHALGAGFKLADDAEVAEQRVRNDANTAVANARGVAEQFASGVTLGGSDLAMEVLGADPAGMRAREEALGSVGSAAHLAGEIAPALLTGGGSAGARGAARFLPGVALDSAAARIGGRSLAVRGAIEGGGYGIGQEIHESVLGETPINAEHLLAGGFTSAVFGGGAGAGLGGLARGGRAVGDGARQIGRNIHGEVAPIVDELGRVARDGSAKLTKGVEDILTRMENGMPPSKMIAEAIAKGDNSLFERGLLFNDAPPEVARRISREFAADPQRFTTLAQGPKLDEDLARLLRDDLNALQSTTDEVILAAEGAAKYKSVDKHIPAGAREQVLNRTADELYKIRDELQRLADDNAGKGFQLYDAGKLDDAQSFVERATAELIEQPGAGHAFEVMDRLKRDLGTLKIFGDPGPMAPSGLGKANAKLRDAYQRIRGHLEREDLWGQAAVRQKVINEAATQDFNAQAAFRGENGQGGLGRIWNKETGEVNARVARRIAKQYGRSGPLAGEHLGDVLEARMRRLEAYAEHTELPDGLKARIAEARASQTRIESALKERAELAGILDDMTTLRGIQTDSSVSTGALSNVAPIVGGVLGSAFGPLGTAAGVVLGQLARPYSAVRGMAGILAKIDDVTKRINITTAKTHAKLFGENVAGGLRAARRAAGDTARGVGRTAARGARATGRGVRKGATAAATHADNREKTMKRVRQLLRDPDALEQALDVPTYDLRTHAPNLERIAAQKLFMAAQYLVQEQPPITTTVFGAEMRDPAAEREFAQCYDAVMDPLGTLELIPEGLFTSKHAKAMQAVYPEMWGAVQSKVLDSLITAQGEGRKIPLDLRSGMGITLGMPTDVGLTPGVATELAMRHSGMVPGLTPPPAPGASGKPRKARAGDIKRTINTYKTPLERAGSD